MAARPPAAPSTSEIDAARTAIGGIARRTPTLPASWLESRSGGSIRLKAENLQVTGSFKVRGAATRLHGLEPGLTEVVTASAGNHGYAVAFVAQRLGLGCRVFAPTGAAVSKERAVRSCGAEWVRGGAAVDECMAAARAYAAERGALFVHPYDDAGVIRGQATLAPELLEQVPDLATVVVPVGGGGLIGGLAAALAELRPEARVVGLQVETCAPLVDGGRIEREAGFSIADGISVKTPGELTRPLIDAYVDELSTISEDAIAEAMGALAEEAKLVVEGAGAIGVAALLSGVVKPAEEGTTVLLLTGGNVDLRRLSAVARLHEARAGGTLRFATRVPDLPGALADLLAAVARTGASVLTVEHVRDTSHRSFRETVDELTLETRDHEHGERILEQIASTGYTVRLPEED